jgi:hypothetical protein
MDSISLNLREYVDGRLGELEKRILAKLHATNDAVSKSERLLDARLEGMNEFRAQLNRQASLFMTRTEIESKLDRLGIEIVAKCEKDCAALNSKIQIVLVLLTSVLAGMIVLLFKVLVGG